MLGICPLHIYISPKNHHYTHLPPYLPWHKPGCSFVTLLTDMGWAAPEVSSDELENLRCFLCCDISVLVPCEFAVDVDTKVLGRSDSLEGSAMEIVLGLYWSSFPYKGDGLTLGRVELHEPVLFLFLDTVKVGLVCWCHAQFDGTVQQPYKRR